LSVVRIDASLFPDYDPGMTPGSHCSGTRDCPECSRLRSTRDLRQLIYATAASRLKSTEARMDAAQWTALQRKSLEAEVDLKLVDAEIAPSEALRGWRPGWLRRAASPQPSGVATPEPSPLGFG
jgi:hypothetical protein